MTFNDCVIECCKQPELIKQYDRLQGSNLSRILLTDTRPAIVKMVDNATGYDKVMEEKSHEDMQGFISFIFEFIWIPLINNGLATVK
jgi:hypothetical protein